MRITVKTVEWLRHHLPGEPADNQAEIEVAASVPKLTEHLASDPSAKVRQYCALILGRIADPKDVVGPTLFFASPASDFVTGQVLYVDGGITASL